MNFEGGPVLGSAEATVGIVEFTDYQCPFCKRFYDQTFGAIKKNYVDNGKIQYRVRDYPLGFHSEAKGASVAARCAGEQGKYWEMRSELFNRQRELGPELYESLAGEIGLKKKAFRKCMDDPERAAEVDESFVYAGMIGVTGTPSFFIGRIEGDQLVHARQISGAQPYSVFAKAIDSQLE